VAPDTPGAVQYHGTHIRCALCHSNGRADAALETIVEAIRTAESAMPGPGAVGDVLFVLRRGLGQVGGP